MPTFHNKEEEKKLKCRRIPRRYENICTFIILVSLSAATACCCSGSTGTVVDEKHDKKMTKIKLKDVFLTLRR